LNRLTVDLAIHLWKQRQKGKLMLNEAVGNSGHDEENLGCYLSSV
jgi:hypothetical protein